MQYDLEATLSLSRGLTEYEKEKTEKFIERFFSKFRKEEVSLQNLEIVYDRIFFEILSFKESAHLLTLNLLKRLKEFLHEFRVGIRTFLVRRYEIRIKEKGKKKEEEILLPFISSIKSNSEEIVIVLEDLSLSFLEKGCVERTIKIVKKFLLEEEKEKTLVFENKGKMEYKGNIIKDLFKKKWIIKTPEIKERIYSREFLNLMKIFSSNFKKIEENSKEVKTPFLINLSSLPNKGYKERLNFNDFLFVCKPNLNAKVFWNNLEFAIKIEKKEHKEKIYEFLENPSYLIDRKGNLKYLNMLEILTNSSINKNSLPFSIFEEEIPFFYTLVFCEEGKEEKYLQNLGFTLNKIDLTYKGYELKEGDKRRFLFEGFVPFKEKWFSFCEFREIDKSILKKYNIFFPKEIKVLFLKINLETLSIIYLSQKGFQSM